MGWETVDTNSVKIPEGFVIENPQIPPGFVVEQSPQKSFARKALDVYTWPTRTGAKALWKGLGVLAWPYQRIESAVAGPTVALQETGWPSAGLMGTSADHDVMGGGEGIKHIAKSFIPPLKSIPRWKMHPETKTFGDVFETYTKKMTKEEPKGFLKGTSTAAGIGTSFLATPALVGGTFKGLTRLGKATPWYKAYQASRLPALEDMILEFGADKAEAIEAARKLGKTVSKKQLIPLASKLFNTTKPTKSQIFAVAKRLKQIEQGGVTARPELAEKAGRFSELWEKTTPALEKAGLLGKETIFTKLTKARKSQLKQQVVALQKQLTKYKGRKFPGRAERMRKLTDKIDDIKLQIYRSEHLGGTLPSGESIPLKYAPRMYSQFEQGGRRWPFFSKFRIRRPYAKHRQDIPLAARKEMGELTGIGYPEVKRAMQVSNDIAVADLFKKIARKREWVDDLAEGFKKLPDSKAFGILAGRSVHPTVYNQVKSVVDVRTNVGKIYDACAGVWKASKVLWNPSTHFRNTFCNSILNDITGTDHIKQAQMAGRLVKEIRNNSDDWLTIKRYLVRSGFSEAELMDDLLNISQGGKPAGGMIPFAKSVKWFQRASAKPGNIYAKEEMLGKALKYLHMRENGMAPLEAVKEANRTLFDYGALHPLEKTVARRVMPFYTFPRKSIPVVLGAMRDNPHAVAKYPIMFWGMQQYSLSKLDMTQADFDELAEQLPDYMQRGSVLLLPYRDKDNKLRFFDWTYILPWGPMAEMNQRGPLDVALSNPLYTLLADLQRNKSSFKDKPIYDDSIPWEDMTPEYRREQYFKIFKYGWQMAAPSLAPEGLYWDKIEQAARGQRPIPETLAHTVFGLRTQAIDPKETKMWHYKGKAKQTGNLSSQLWGLSLKKARGKISDEEYEKQRKMLIDQTKHLTEQQLLLKTAR
jgi:hypothetical protein